MNQFLFRGEEIGSEGNRAGLCGIEFHRNKQSLRRSAGKGEIYSRGGRDCMLMNELDPRDTRRISGAL